MQETSTLKAVCSPGLPWNCQGDTWAAVSPSSTGLRCVLLEISDFRGAAQLEGWGGAVRSLAAFAFLPAGLCCRCLSWLGNFCAVLQAACQEGLPGHWEVGWWLRHSACAEALCYRGYAAEIFVLGCHEQRRLVGTLWSHCKSGKQILARTLPFPYCVGKSPNLSVTCRPRWRGDAIHYEIRIVD